MTDGSYFRFNADNDDDDDHDDDDDDDDDGVKELQTFYMHPNRNRVRW